MTGIITEQAPKPDAGDDAAAAGARQLTTLRGWRGFVAEHPAVPQLLAEQAGGASASTTGPAMTKRGWRTTRNCWWSPLPPSSR